MSDFFSGSGPGERTSDGCSVSLYARMPYLGELDSVRPLLTPGASVLELGAGAGRLTRKLLERGLNVTAVDNSADMLAYVLEMRIVVVSDIENLRLVDTFDNRAACELSGQSSVCVDQSIVAATARYHVAPGGQLLVECHDADSTPKCAGGTGKLRRWPSNLHRSCAPVRWRH